MASFSSDFWGLYLTLTEDETKEVENAADLGAAISAIVAAGAGAPTGGTLTVVATGLTAYLELEKALMAAVDQGAGVTLNLPWLAIFDEQFWLIYPTAVSVKIQKNWQWCSRCSGLFWNVFMNAPGGRCPTGGEHGPNFSSNYRLVMDVPSYQGQHQWRFCNNCHGLFYAGGGTSAGVCPAGGQHAEPSGGSSDYALVMDVPGFSGQHQWRWCNKCQGLFFAGGSTSAGVCPAGGQHAAGFSSDYALMS